MRISEKIQFMAEKTTDLCMIARGNCRGASNGPHYPMLRFKRISYTVDDQAHVRQARVHYEIERFFESRVSEMALTAHEQNHHIRTETHAARESESYTEYLIYRNRTIAVGAYRYTRTESRTEGRAAELMLSSYAV